MPRASFPPRGDRLQPPDLNRRSRSGQLTFGQTEFSMKHLLTGGALALALFASHAAAQDEGAAEITVDAPLLHPAAGLMNDHMHDGGEVMVGLRLERSRWSGANRSGTEALSDAAIAAAGYTARTASMEMDMAMLDLMFAPNDNLTLMVMPMYMRHRMTMVDAGQALADELGCAPGERFLRIDAVRMPAGATPASGPRHGAPDGQTGSAPRAAGRGSSWGATGSHTP